MCLGSISWQCSFRKPDLDRNLRCRLSLGGSLGCCGVIVDWLPGQRPSSGVNYTFWDSRRARCFQLKPETQQATSPFTERETRKHHNFLIPEIKVNAGRIPPEAAGSAVSGRVTGPGQATRRRWSVVVAGVTLHSSSCFGDGRWHWRLRNLLAGPRRAGSGCGLVGRGRYRRWRSFSDRRRRP